MEVGAKDAGPVYNHAGEEAASGGRLGRGGDPKYLPGELRMALGPPQDPPDRLGSLGGRLKFWGRRSWLELERRRAGPQPPASPDAPSARPDH